jgi:hypothetical protein
MPGRWLRLGSGIALGLGLAGSACAPPACQDLPDKTHGHDVELVVKDDGPIGRAAAERLAARGKEAIAVIETGLYRAEPTARLRLVRLLRTIGAASPAARAEVRPVLAHLARFDSDAEVREASRVALTP